LRGALANPQEKKTDKKSKDTKDSKTSPQKLGEPKEEGKPVAAIDDKSDEDYQLSRALDLVRGISLYAERSQQPSAPKDR
jgi:hypothetical protein